MSYPEHDKLSLISDESQAVGSFLDTCPYTLCEWKEASEDPDDEWDGGYLPVPLAIERILAKHYGIDLDLIDAEKRAMLDAIRATNAEAPETIFEGLTPPE